MTPRRPRSKRRFPGVAPLAACLLLALTAPAASQTCDLRSISVILHGAADADPGTHALRLGSEQAARILAARSLKKVTRDFEVGGVRYRSERLLGNSSARVYLGSDPWGRPVVIKNYRWGSYVGWLMGLMNEVLLTRYLRARGVDVPDVVAVDYRKQHVVKVYHEGLTWKEIRESPDLSEADRIILYSELEGERDRIKAVIRGYPAWLRSREPPLPRKVVEALSRERGDLKDDNFVFDLRRRRWILFDP